EAGGRQLGVQVLLQRALVPRGVDGVEADQPLQQRRRVALEILRPHRRGDATDAARLACMSDYAIKNLMDVEPSNGGPGEQIDVRFTRRHLDSRELGVSYFRYGPGFRTIGHKHEVQEEAYVVVGGSGRIKLEDELLELRRWDVVRVAPHVTR